MSEVLIPIGGGGGTSSDDVTAARKNILRGKTAITSDSDDEIVEGTMPDQGAKTAELILQKKYGYMTCVKENKIDIIPISEVAGKTKLVDTDSDIIRQAKFAGLSFGDEPCGI